MTVPVSNIYLRFSNTAIDYTAFGMNVANVNCNENASMMKLSVNGNTKFRIDMDGNLLNQREVVYIPAKAMIPSMTNGAAFGYFETPTSQLVQNTMDFSNSTEQSVQFDIVMPKSWNKSNVKFRVVGAPISNGTAASTNNVVWRAQAVAISNNDFWDPVMTSNTFIKMNMPTFTRIQISDESPPLTVDGNPSDSDIVFFKFYRDTANVEDTNVRVTNLFGIQLILNP